MLVIIGSNVINFLSTHRAECENFMTCSVPEPTLLSSIEEKRLAWIKSFKPWFEIFKQNQQKKIVKRKRLVKCPVNTMPPLNTLEILQCGPWNNLQQVFCNFIILFHI